MIEPNSDEMWRISESMSVAGLPLQNFTYDALNRFTAAVTAKRTAAALSPEFYNCRSGPSIPLAMR